MTSTHLGPDAGYANVEKARQLENMVYPLSTTPIDSQSTIGKTNTLEDDAASVGSSFSDAYKEEPAENNASKGADGGNQGDEVSDDYAMTFDSDGEEHSDSQDVSKPDIEAETKTLLVLPSDSNADLPSASPDVPPTQVPETGSAPKAPADHMPHLEPDSIYKVHLKNTGHSLIQSPVHPTTDIKAVNDLGSSAAQEAIETANPHTTHSYEDIANGGIDIQQLLDNITANAEKNEPRTATASTLPQPPNGLPAHASLPPRPNLPQKRPFNDDIQKYHAGPPNILLSSNSFRPPGVPLIAAGAPGTSTDPRGGLPPPPTASFKDPSLPLPSPIAPGSHVALNRTSAGKDAQTSSVDSRDEADDLDEKWGPEVQKIYDQFLEYERQNVTEGAWDRFPNNSRLFIGNLPSEKVTKRDLFHVFYHYGKLAQVSIKQAYGFIQFEDNASCAAALKNEQGAEVRGRRMHLEISKPQKSSNAERGVGQVKRPRSPDYRQVVPDRGGRAQQGQYSRYERPPPAMRQDEYGRPLRVRDDYRPARPATPPRGGYRGRDEYSPHSRDTYDAGYDRRRSRSPYGYNEPARYRERSLSPRRREANEDSDLQIPRRDSHNIPDVQIILMDQLDHGFVSWVEAEIRSRGVQVQTMFLSSRLPLQTVIRRQILEGVHAVSKLDFGSQVSSKIPLQVFDRQGGADNVRFDEYLDLEPRIAAELVLRAKQTQVQSQGPVYTRPQFAAGQSYQPSAAPAATNIASLVGQLDNATLQKLLSTINTPQQPQNAQAVAANSQLDLVSLLSGLQPQQPPQQSYQQAYQAPPPATYAGNPALNPALASLLGNVAPQAPANQNQPQSAQQVQNIMAQLARFRQ